MIAKEHKQIFLMSKLAVFWDTYCAKLRYRGRNFFLSSPVYRSGFFENQKIVLE